MKPASTALIAYLNPARNSPDAPLIFADVFTFTLVSGLMLGYTNVDIGFTYNGVTYLANSVRIDGLKYKAAIGSEVDRHAPRPRTAHPCRRFSFPGSTL